MTLVNQAGQPISSGQGGSQQAASTAQQAAGQQPAGGAAAAGELVKDVGTNDFMQEVVDASMQGAVIVDFWAPWCEPCKQLTPLLEKHVQAAGGKVKLCKLNVDEHRDIAQQLQVQSLPTVYAFIQGRPADGFQGAQPESEVKALVERLTQMVDQMGLPGLGGGAGPSADELLAQARDLFQRGEFQAAGEMYGRVMEQDPQNLEAITGLGHAYLALGDKDTPQQILDQIPQQLRQKSEVEGLRSALELAQAGKGDTKEVAKLKKKLDKDDNDHQARYDLALALYNQGDKQGAVDHLLTIVERDRSWGDDAARQQLLKLFEAIGHSDPVVADARRRLSRLLFS